MVNTKKTVYGLFTLIVLCLLAQTVCLSAAEDEIAVTAKAYVGNAYTESGDRCTPFGTLTLSGVEKTDDSNVFYAEDSVSMSFRYNVHLLPEGLKDDDETIVCGRDMGASVRHGMIVIEKRTTGQKEWETVFAASDIFDSHPEGIESLYTLPFKELFLGCRYRVTLAYQCGHNHYLQRYEPELLPINYVAMVRDLGSTEETAFITNNGSTIQGFELIFLADEEKITVSYNGGEAKVYTSQNAVSFTKPGEYRLQHKLWGRTATCNIYVLPSEKELLDEFFGGSMISESTRVFTSEVLPCYNKVALIHFNESEYLPVVIGEAQNLTTEETRSFDSESGTVAISGEGEWEISVKVGESGSFYEFSTTVKILDESPRQSVNEWLLQTCDNSGAYVFVKVPYQNDQAILAKSAHGVYMIVPDVPLGKQIPAGEYIIEEYTANKLTYSYTLYYTSSCMDGYTESEVDQMVMPVQANGSESPVYSPEEKPSLTVRLTVVMISCLVAVVATVTVIIKKRKLPCEHQETEVQK